MRKSDVVRHFGSQLAVAKALQITKGAVSFWDELIPIGRAYQIESVTGGKLRVNPALYKTASHSRRPSAAHPS